MTSRAAKCCLYLIAACVVAACLGCADRNLYNKRYFVLDVKRPAEGLIEDAEVVLEVRRFSIDSRFDSKDMVYRRGEFEYESDFHNEYLVAPEVMITDQVRRWLANSGLFKKVLEPGSLLEATHTMEGSITELYADFSNESEPLAVIEIDFFVIQHQPSEKALVYSQHYKASEVIEGRSPESVVEGLNRCLETILSNLEKGVKAGP